MRSFIEDRDILNSSQYGFRKAHSTKHAIWDIVNAIQTNMDRRLFSCGVFIDLKKAFDTVDHSILLSKLNFYGFRGIINNWFSSYLRNKLQIGQHVSDKVEINYGVPQGSILGPLLFLLCINDIQNCSNSYTNILYADKNLRVLEQTVTLTLNIKKSNSPLSKETYY